MMQLTPCMQRKIGRRSLGKRRQKPWLLHTRHNTVDSSSTGVLRPLLAGAASPGVGAGVLACCWWYHLLLLLPATPPLLVRQLLTLQWLLGWRRVRPPAAVAVCGALSALPLLLRLWERLGVSPLGL